jgi:outer membrane lipoprotein-sorting protein
MKLRLLLLPLLVMAPVAASAQLKPKASTPQISIDPAAKALLDRATATYKGVQGLRFQTSTQVNGKNTPQLNTISSFQRPDSFRLDDATGRLLAEANQTYFVTGTTYQRREVFGSTPRSFTGDSASHGTSGSALQQIMWMLDGLSPLDAALKFAAHSNQRVMPPINPAQVRAQALGSRLVDSDVLQGVRLTLSFPIFTMIGEARRHSYETTLWFGGPQTLLRRVQTRSYENGNIQTVTEKLFNQQLNPTLQPEFFVFDLTGLKLEQPLVH